ncbi:hypothetical protein [Jiella mangrovi]|uniref:Restriction system protein Mrr-like N-terminal domain-containing protein n=1 Tax=Jiella mangrovi TaxID=2821407 RepID=A0ABS4BCI5_9HYPH|nr:hypothetical protein [Jiella mangrovi]MBP0614453.1 hypothetical protein [Jiella mangrovi]
MKELLEQWILEGVRANGGAATVLEVAKYLWEHHEAELRGGGDYFYTWQYDMRWAGQRLRDDGFLELGPNRTWQLVAG